jgi:hypothetical protein
MISTWILILLLFVSIAINVLLAWYCKKLLNYLSLVNDDTEELLLFLSEYEVHLKDVYNRELFYGEPVLESLLKHTKDTADKIEFFVDASVSSTTETVDE